MRRSTVLAAGFSAILVIVAATPALAGHGALARDDDSGKYGLSSNEESQSKADDVALKICGGDKCKIVFRTAARECGAIATAEGRGRTRRDGELPEAHQRPMQDPRRRVQPIGKPSVCRSVPLTAKQRM